MKEWGLMRMRRARRATVMGVALALGMRLAVYVFKQMLRMILIVASVDVVGAGHVHCARTARTVHWLRLHQAHAVRHVGVQTVIGSLRPQLAHANAPVPRRHVSALRCYTNE